MRYGLMLLCALFLSCSLWAQTKSDEGPSNEKAQRTYKEAFEYLHRRMKGPALESFKKADKQDGGHCLACQRKMIHYGMELGDWKTAELGAEEMIAEAQNPKPVAVAHYWLGVVLFREGLYKEKDELFARSHEQLLKALADVPNFVEAIFLDGLALARANKDAEARARFEQIVRLTPEDNADHERALRYISQPELARARMAPPFAITTAHGQHISMDELAGKVLLIDFWATWCSPCREAIPHMRDIARKFQGEPLVVLSISLDKDEAKWKDFVAKNEMTWPQYRDGEGFTGSIAKMFGVEAIPHTFTIDADGVLQDEHIGDASVEGKLKKLIARARTLQASKKTEESQ